MRHVRSAAACLVFASYVSADAVGLTLAVTATYAGSRAIENPTRGAQIVFLAFAGLAFFARIQYVILFAAFLVGAWSCAAVRSEP